MGSEVAHVRGEGDDLYYRFCYRDLQPLDREFVDLAVKVYGPLLDHLVEEKRP